MEFKHVVNMLQIWRRRHRSRWTRWIPDKTQCSAQFGNSDDNSRGTRPENRKVLTLRSHADMQRHAETCRDMQRHAETCRQKYQTDIRKVRKEMGGTVWESYSKDSALYGPLNLFIRNLQGGWLTLLALIQVKDNAAISVSIPKQGLFNEKACWAAPGEEVDTSRLGCWPKDTKIPKNKIRYI